MQRRKNETLLALILSDLEERIEHARMLVPPSVEHHKAAMVLVSERGLESFRDNISQSLLDAVRYIVVRKALWASDEEPDLGVFARSEKGRSRTHAVALDQIGSRVLVLRSQVSACLRDKYRDASWVLERLSVTRRLLDTQLVEWIESVAHWHPSLQPDPSFERRSRRRGLVEIYSSCEVALVYNQCRCFQLMLLGISQSLPLLEPETDMAGGFEAMENTRGKAQTLCEAILSAAPFLLGGPRENGARVPDTSTPAYHWEDILTTDEKVLKNYMSGRHWNLFELSQWMLRILKDAEHGVEVSPQTIVEAKEYLASLW